MVAGPDPFLLGFLWGPDCSDARIRGRTVYLHAVLADGSAEL